MLIIPKGFNICTQAEALYLCMLKSADYKGIEVFYEVKGKGKRTVVLLHGFLEDQTIWKEYQTELAKSSRVLAISLLGHGKTPCIGYHHSMEEMAGAVKGVLKNENIRKAIFVGHSMGGYVALAYADLFPDGLNGLVLFNSTAKADSEQKVKDRKRAIEVVKRNHEMFIKEAIPNLFVGEKNPKLRGAIKRTLNVALSTPKQGIVAALEGMKDRKDREIILRFAPYPYLCLAGKNDQIVRWRDLEKAAELNELGQFHLSEKGGHMCIYEDQYPCLTVLKKFIIDCKKT